MKKKIIPILCAADDNYAIQCKVTLCSILENTSEPERIKINLFSEGMSEENFKGIQKFVESYGSKLEKINLCKADFKIIKLISLGRYGISGISRLFLFNKFKEKQLIYLDVDMIVLGDLVKFSDSIKSNKTLFAVYDYLMRFVYKKKYFNSGFLIINPQEWKKREYSKKAINWYKQNKNRTTFPDQDILNGILKDDWSPLPFEWNRQRIVLDYSRKKLGINKKLYKKLIHFPKIIHYTGKIKPWNYKYIFPDKKYYLYYLKKSGQEININKKNIFDLLYRFFRYVVYKLKLREHLEGRKFIPKKWR